MLPRFEVRVIVDRDCELSNLIADYPQIIGYFTDSDCENGASNTYAKSFKDEYHLCDYHLGQLLRSGLTDQNQNAIGTMYSPTDPSASWNNPK